MSVIDKWLSKLQWFIFDVDNRFPQFNLYIVGNALQDFRINFTMKNLDFD